jgi:hypothetical protein
MKYGQKEVLELKIFSDDGKLITTLDTLKQSEIFGNHVYVKDALLDRNMLEFIGSVEKLERSDFETQLEKSKFNTTIVFNHVINKKCKLIGNGIFRQSDTAIDVEFLFEVPMATLKRGLEFEQSNTKVSDFDLYFVMVPYNDNGDLYKIHI